MTVRVHPGQGEEGILPIPKAPGERQIGEAVVSVSCNKESMQPGPRTDLKVTRGLKGQAGEGCP